MEQTKQDLENIKTKVIEHLKKTYPEDKANEYISNINSMDDGQFTEFLKQQGLIPGKEEEQNQQCIFCSILSGNTPSTKIAENEKAITILELNPITQGHSLIIPKDHLDSEDKLPQEAKDLANQVSENLKKAFNPQRIDIIPGNVMGHQIINLLPIYNNETIESPRQQQTPEALAQLKSQIEKAKPEQITTSTIQKENQEEDTIETFNSEEIILPKRIP